jgi:ubiquitin C-terminal hydrolase
LATLPLAAHFAPGPATLAAAAAQPPPASARVGAHGRAGDGVVAAAFGRLVSEMAAQRAFGAVAPRELKAVVARQAPWLAGYQQQDCQEFLRFLLDGLSEDLNRHNHRLPLSAATSVGEAAAAVDSHVPATAAARAASDSPGGGATDGGAADDADGRALAERTWLAARAHHASIVEDAFGGQLRSKVECTVCGTASFCFDPFLDVSLPIPDADAHATRQGHRSSSSSGRGVSLEACLAAFCATEVLAGDDAYTCRSCATRQTCLKTLTLHRAPPHLVLHLKRFAYTPCSREKLTTPVRFPIRGLDLAPFLTPSSASSGRHHEGGDGELSVLYDLYGVANHVGALGGGHYTAACCHAPGQWLAYNDSHVAPLADPARDLCPEDAYVLFYQRRRPS